MIVEQSEIELLSRLKSLQPYIGNTPLFPLKKAYRKQGVEIFAKLEWLQFGGSVKSRPAFNIVSRAVASGAMDMNKELLDASSGNTAIAYAAIGAALGIPVTICLPENASEEKKSALKAHGANIHYTSRFGTTDEAQVIAQGLDESNPGKYFYADQYNNENNWKAHYLHTGVEIWQQSKTKITHFVAGLGTTGSFTGISNRLLEFNENIQLISLQPETALHGLEGWKHMESAMVPGIYEPSLAHQNLFIDTDEAYYWIKKVARDEGLLLSPSAAANLAGAVRVAENINEGIIVTLFPDAGDSYKEVIKSLFP